MAMGRSILSLHYILLVLLISYCTFLILLGSVDGQYERLGEMRKGRRERIEKGSRESIRRERKEKQKDVEKTIRRGGGGTSPLASVCYTASSRPAVLLQRQEFPTRFCGKVLQQ